MNKKRRTPLRCFRVSVLPANNENQRTDKLIAIETSPRENISPEDFVPPRKFRAHRKDRPVTHLRLDCGQTVQSMEEGKAALLTAYSRQ